MSMLNPSGSTRATKHEWSGENMHPPPHPMGPKEIDGVFVPPDKASTLLTYHLITCQPLRSEPMVRTSASGAGGRGFDPGPGHTKELWLPCLALSIIRQALASLLPKQNIASLTSHV